MTPADGGWVSGREKLGGTEWRCGGGGGVAGARGTTLGEATTEEEAGGGVGWRWGGGGGDRNEPGAGTLGMMPRDEGGGGMRDVGAALPSGRGGKLTGLGATLTGAVGGADVTTSEAVEALGSFSSPIESLAGQPFCTAHANCNPKRRYSRTIS